MNPHVPEKYPLDEIAYITCLCCKVRFHPSFFAPEPTAPVHFICSDCFDQMPVGFCSVADLAREVRGGNATS